MAGVVACSTVLVAGQIGQHLFNNIAEHAHDLREAQTRAPRGPVAHDRLGEWTINAKRLGGMSRTALRMSAKAQRNASAAGSSPIQSMLVMLVFVS